jgi:ribosomal protein S12 methylthiotransferase
MNISILNLGCPRNQKDGEVALSHFLKNGFLITNKIDKADVIIVNTCSFIDDAKEESVEEIINIINYKKKSSILILMGCLVELYSKELLKELPEVDIFIGVNDFYRIYDIYREFLNNKKRVILNNKKRYIEEDFLYNNYLNNLKLSSYVKYSEGCSNKCSYCLIPKIRGEKVLYREEENVISEIKYLVKNGVKEVVLIAQDLVSDKNKLKKMLIKISKLKNKPKWLRLMYCNPWGVDEELINIISSEEFIVNYIDMPVQHISPKILKRMNRYRGIDIYKNLELLKEKNISVRSTVMTGFPGEKDKDFNDLCKLVKKGFFHYLGIFVYSEQLGVEARDKFLDKVPKKIAIERRNILDRLQFDITNFINESYLGKSLKVLPDNSKIGRAFFQAPEVDGVVHFNKKVATKDFIEVVINKVSGYDLYGKIR